MKPLVVLLLAFVIALLIMKLMKGQWDFVYSGMLAMAVMLLFTSIGHFRFSKGMTMMLPSFLPAKELLVFLTGLIEILAAIGLAVPATRTRTAYFLIIFFVLLLPANIIAAVKGVNIEGGTLDGPGTSYLWFRIPLQALFIAWTYWFVLSKWAQENSSSY
jgi:uncharacterized membrane protein